MSKTSEVLRGIVHGKSIELEHPLPMPDGSEIELVVQRTPISAEQRKQRLNASELHLLCVCLFCNAFKGPNLSSVDSVIVNSDRVIL